jgi:hypothetical protein
VGLSTRSQVQSSRNGTICHRLRVILHSVGYRRTRKRSLIHLCTCTGAGHAGVGRVHDQRWRVCAFRSSPMDRARSEQPGLGCWSCLRARLVEAAQAGVAELSRRAKRPPATTFKRGLGPSGWVLFFRWPSGAIGSPVRSGPRCEPLERPGRIGYESFSSGRARGGFAGSDPAVSLCPRPD